MPPASVPRRIRLTPGRSAAARPRPCPDRRRDPGRQGSGARYRATVPRQPPPRGAPSSGSLRRPSPAPAA